MTITPDDLKKQDEEEGQLPSRPRYIVRDATYFLGELPQEEPIVEGMINTRKIGVFFGDGGTKKTYSMIHMATCVAMGKSWLDFEVKQTGVLFIDEESGELGLARRIRKTLRGEFGNEEVPLMSVSMAGFRLDRKEDLPEIQNLISESRAGLVIFDALSEAMDGDENSKQDVQPVFSAARWLSETTGATIIFIHHSNKQGGFRGSTVIRNSVDFMYKVTSEDASNIVSFRSEKVRDGKSAYFVAMAHWVDSEDQFYMTPMEARTKVKKMTDGMRYALEYLKKHGESDLDDIVAAADFVSERQASDGVRKLAHPDWKLAYRTNPEDKGPGTKARYAATQAGIDYETEE